MSRNVFKMFQPSDLLKDVFVFTLYMCVYKFTCNA